VREYSVPATLRVADDETLVDAVFANAARDASALAYRRRGPDRRWSDVTAGAFAAEVTAVARGLIAAGVEPGERVALLSRTRYEWTLVDYAILAVGAATVPIYETSSAEQIRWILSDSGAVAAVVETAKHAALVEQARDAAVELKVWRIAPEGDEPGAVERLVTRGADVPEEAVLERRRAVQGDSAVLADILRRIPSKNYDHGDAWVLGRLKAGAADSVASRFRAADTEEFRVRYLTLLSYFTDPQLIPLLARIYAAPASFRVPKRYAIRASDGLLWIGTKESLQALLNARAAARSRKVYADSSLVRGGYDFLADDSSAVISRTGQWLTDWVTQLPAGR